jgi:hypothetical protein
MNDTNLAEALRGLTESCGKPLEIYHVYHGPLPSSFDGLSNFVTLCSQLKELYIRPHHTQGENEDGDQRLVSLARLCPTLQKLVVVDFNPINQLQTICEVTICRIIIANSLENIRLFKLYTTQDDHWWTNSDLFLLAGNEFSDWEM